MPPTAERRIPSLILAATLLAGCSSEAPVASASSGASGSPSTSASASPAHDGGGGRTSCTNVLYVGESTSIGLVSPLQVPAANERLQARMADVGVTRLSINVSGGRSAYERLQGRANTLDVITPEVAKRFTGCYVLALGTNDAANGSAPGTALTIRERIDTVMTRIGSKRPVLWPITDTADWVEGPYTHAHMAAFAAELRAATKRYPNLRLYDWAAELDQEWFEGDGIHDLRVGSRHRALMYARALAVAFPAGAAANPSAVVGSIPGKPASSANRPKLAAAQGDRSAAWAADAQALILYTDGPKP